MSGFVNGLREGCKAVTAPGYDGQLIAFGTLLAENTSNELDAFRTFTTERENREKAQIPEEAIDLAVGLAANGEDGMKKASFSMDPTLQAETLKYLSSFDGGMEDPDGKRNMLQKVLTIREKHQGVDHVHVAKTLRNLSDAYLRVDDPWTQKELLERALKIFQDNHGEDHVCVAQTLGSLATTHLQLGDNVNAEEVL